MNDYSFMANLTPKLKAAAETVFREGVFEAVLQVLKKQGLDKLTVQRVADAAGISAGTVYNYFKSKDDLLVYTAERIFDDIRNRQIEAVTAAKNPLEKLQAFLDTSFTFFSNNASIFNFLDQAHVYCKIDLAVKHNHVNEEVRILTDIIVEGVKTVLFCTKNAEKMAAFLHRAMIGTLCVNPELGEFSPHDEAISLCQLFFDNLIKSI